MPSHEKIRLINTILNLYYVDQLTQTEIADRLELSTTKVNRLLQQARELGYITYVIRTPFQSKAHIVRVLVTRNGWLCGCIAW